MYGSKWIGCLLAGLLCLATAAPAGAVVNAGEPTKNPDAAIGRNLEILVDMYRDINLLYVDEVDPDRLMEDAAAGMTNRLDPYTEFIPERRMADFEVLTTGKYGGIGSMIRKKGDYVVLARPYEGSPADKAGLRIGDRILAIEGADAKGLSLEEVSARLKGDPGTSVGLTVLQYYTGDTVSLTLMRERIVISGVPFYGFINDSIGYIEHNDFTEDCAADMLKALRAMKDSGRLKGLVIDLRGNGGGILQEAVKIVSMFVPRGTEVVSIKGKVSRMDATFRTETDPVDTELPVVILTDNGSASASEIVSGALQDLDRAVLMGQRTFGKGLVQNTRPVGYNSFLKLTTAKYYMPSGRCIQAIDYTHRNENGSVGTLPDSLIREFRTLAGRKVYDGGGIMPDVKIEPEYVSRFVFILYNKGYIEDWADAYCKDNRSEAIEPGAFRLTDAEYDDFVDYMLDKDLAYESETMLALKALKERAERERYLAGIAEELERIEQSLGQDSLVNYRLYKKEIGDLLENEIILRRHYATGVTRHMIGKDPTVLAAAQLLADPERYRRIVTSQDTERK